MYEIQALENMCATKIRILAVFISFHSTNKKENLRGQKSLSCLGTKSLELEHSIAVKQNNNVSV
jgi:hypothetical protein